MVYLNYACIRLRSHSIHILPESITMSSVAYAYISVHRIGTVYTKAWILYHYCHHLVLYSIISMLPMSVCVYKRRIFLTARLNINKYCLLSVYKSFISHTSNFTTSLELFECREWCFYNVVHVFKLFCSILYLWMLLTHKAIITFRFGEVVLTSCLDWNSVPGRAQLGERITQRERKRKGQERRGTELGGWDKGMRVARSRSVCKRQKNMIEERNEARQARESEWEKGRRGHRHMHC